MRADPLNCCIWTLFFAVLLVQTAGQQTFDVSSSPIITQNGSLENISICFADCQSCTSQNGQCEDCFAPWFIKDLNGICQVRDDITYVEESTEQERIVSPRIASLSWLINGQVTKYNTCSLKDQSGNNLTNFNVTGMLKNQNLIYQRTISIHDYFGMKFLLILANWCADCRLTIRLSNEDNQTLATETLTATHPRVINATKENICSGTVSDQRLSFVLNIRERQSRQLTLSFQPLIPDSSGSQWGVSTFVLITGKCNSSCETCDGFSSNINVCEYCKNFLAQSDQGVKCSGCLPGFVKSSTNDSCEKCEIEFEECGLAASPPPPQQPIACQYPDLVDTFSGCSFSSNEFFTDSLYVQDRKFSSSLFNVAGRGSSAKLCGDTYSLIGPANPGDLVSRTFLKLPPHIEMSINFNVFIIDQSVATKRYTVVLRVDGKTIELDRNKQVMTITGTSNVCEDYKKVEAITTFETNQFFEHDKTDNVRVEIGLGAVTTAIGERWGLRDIRIVYRLCDQNCAVCSESGCVTCIQNLQLEGLRCTGCLAGTGRIKGEKQCGKCDANCQECTIEHATKKTCTKCFSGYYLYTSPDKVTSCEIFANYYPAIAGGDNSWRGSLGGFRCSLLYNEKPSDGTNLQFSSWSNFTTANNSMNKTFTTGPGTYKKLISFNLLKIDDWGSNFLDIYVNDLLVYHKQFNNTGRPICFDFNQNDQVIYEEFIIEDSNETTTVEFEVVDPNYWLFQSPTKPPNSSTFGINNFKLQKISCAECAEQKFGYQVKYNMDDTLKVFVEFNRVYVNNDVRDFKNIFVLSVDGRQTDYDLYWNNSIRYILSAQVNEEFMGRNVTVDCRYPQRVIANLDLSINQDQFFSYSQRRSLQENSIDKGAAKTLDLVTNFVNVQRFTPLGTQKSTLKGLAIFFEVVSRIVIYLGLASFFIGLQTVCTHIMHNLQKLWVHIFVASLIVSPILRTVLTGFRETQGQNIAINPVSWQAGLPQYLFYDTSAPLQQYYSDINFYRNIYSVGLAFLILIIVYPVMRFLTAKFIKKRDNSLIYRHLRMTFQYRSVWYLNSVIYYQYFTVVIACALQFTDLNSHTSDSTVFNGLSAAAAIIAFIFATVYPIAIHFYISHRRKTLIGVESFDNKEAIRNMDVDAYLNNHVIYNNKYSEIFLRFLPKNLWSRLGGEIAGIEERQFFYNVLRFGEMWWMAIVTIMLTGSPFVQAFLLLLTTTFHLLIVVFFRLSFTKIFKILKSLELLLFLGIEIIIIVMERLSQTLREDTYSTLGIVATVFVALIILLSLIRVFYTAKRIYWEYDNDKHIMEGLTEYIRIIPNEQGEFDID